MQTKRPTPNPTSIRTKPALTKMPHNGNFGNFFLFLVNLTHNINNGDSIILRNRDTNRKIDTNIKDNFFVRRVEKKVFFANFFGREKKISPL